MSHFRKPPSGPLLSSLDQGGVQGVSDSYDNVNRLTQIETEANSTVHSSHAYLYIDA